MARRISIKQMRKDAPAWIFPWLRKSEFAYGSWLAFGVTAGVFVLLVIAVRVQLTPPAKLEAPRASWIHAGADDLGTMLAQRAREGGPHPTRFLPSSWAGFPSLNQIVQDIASSEPVPAGALNLKPFPSESSSLLRLAPRGEPVLPAPLIPSLTDFPSQPLAVKPVITAISGILPAEIPQDLPAIHADWTPSVTAQAARFLLRIDASGTVLDCISMAGGGAGLSPLELWLRAVRFPAAAPQAERWIAIGVGFINQTKTDGTDNQ